MAVYKTTTAGNSLQQKQHEEVFKATETAQKTK
jgi:hypothetical protein